MRLAGRRYQSFGDSPACCSLLTYSTEYVRFRRIVVELNPRLSFCITRRALSIKSSGELWRCVRVDDGRTAYQWRFSDMFTRDKRYRLQIGVYPQFFFRFVGGYTAAVWG